MRRSIILGIVLASLHALLWSAQVASATPPSWGMPHTIGLELEPQSIAVGDTVRFVIYFTPCTDVESLNVSLKPIRPVGIGPLGYLPKAFYKFARKGEIIRISGSGVFHCPGLYLVSVWYSHVRPSGYPPPVRDFRSFHIRIPGGLVKPRPFGEQLPIRVEPARESGWGGPCGLIVSVENPVPQRQERIDTTGVRPMTSGRPERKIPSAEDSLVSVEYSACVGDYSYRISISEHGDFEYLEYEKGWNDGKRAVGEHVRSSVVGKVSVHDMRQLFEVVTEDCFMSWDIRDDTTTAAVNCGYEYERLEVRIKGRTNSYTTYQPFALLIARIREKLCEIKMKVEEK